jgi:hypothetical protein
LPDPVEDQIERLHERLAILEERLTVPTPEWQVVGNVPYRMREETFIHGGGI